MYRYRATQQVLYGRFNEFLKAWQELNIIFHRRGWPEATVWVPTVGTGNEVVLEMDFPDLADFQKWYQAFQADLEGMNLYRATKDVVVQGSLHDELIERVMKPIA
jgi:hypothetical protein